MGTFDAFLHQPSDNFYHLPFLVETTLTVRPQRNEQQQQVEIERLSWHTWLFFAQSSDVLLSVAEHLADIQGACDARGQ